MQINGPNERGVTTVEAHELTTWAPATATTTPAVKTRATDMPSMLSLAKSIRDKRKN